MPIINVSKIIKSNFFIQLSSYTGFQAANKIIPFLILPLFSRIFTKEEMGFYTLYQSIIVILVPLLTLSLNNAISVNFFRLKKSQFSIYFSNVLFIVLPIIVTSILILFIVGDFISKKIGFPYIGLLITSFVVLPNFLIQLRLLLYRNQNKIKSFGTLSISNTILTNSIGLFFVFFAGLSWKEIGRAHV